jgi:AcrR family transcriptional regulator
MEPGRSSGGLRQAKKLQVRETIRRQAFRLFAERGFAATTVEQIAEAANISPRTLFRYFPTKDAIVLADTGGDRLAGAVRRQPSGRNRISAIRGAVHDLFGTASPEERRAELMRDRLVAGNPELAAVALTRVRDSIDALTSALGARSPLTGDTNHSLAGMVVGLLLASDLPDQTTDDEFVRRVDAGLDSLARGFGE